MTMIASFYSSTEYVFGASQPTDLAAWELISAASDPIVIEDPIIRNSPTTGDNEKPIRSLEPLADAVLQLLYA